MSAPPASASERFSHTPARAQRARILTAATEALAQVGHAQLTVDQIIRRAGISRRSFYRHFKDTEQCVLEAFEDALERIGAALLHSGALTSQGPWPERLRAFLTTLLSILDQAPALTRLCIIEALKAGPTVRLRRAQLIEELARLLLHIQSEERPGAIEEVSPLIAQAAVGGALSFLHDHLLAQEPAPLSTLLGPLMAVLIAPYLGHEAATAELERQAPSAPDVSLHHLHEHLDALEVRLTHRAAELLRFIASNPGVSNREIAQGCGGLDRGQVSRMLRRMAEQGLIENLSRSRALGGPNAWRASGKGVRVLTAGRTPTAVAAR